MENISQSSLISICQLEYVSQDASYPNSTIHYLVGWHKTFPQTAFPEGLDDNVLKILLPAGTCFTAMLSCCCSWTLVAMVENFTFHRTVWVSLWKGVCDKQQPWANHGRNLNRILSCCCAYAIYHFANLLLKMMMLAHSLADKHCCLSQFCLHLMCLLSVQMVYKHRWIWKSLHAPPITPFWREDLQFL